MAKVVGNFKTELIAHGSSAAKVPLITVTSDSVLLALGLRIMSDPLVRCTLLPEHSAYCLIFPPQQACQATSL